MKIIDSTPVVKYLPLEEGKTYFTKFATKERFTIKRIDKNSLGMPITIWGTYEHSPHINNCPLNPARLIPDIES